VHVK